MITQFLKFSKYRISFLLLSVCCWQFLSASDITVKSNVDSTIFLIGNQTKVHFVVSQPADKIVAFPVFIDNMAEGVEIVNDLKADTTDLGNNRIEIKKDYLVSAYDSGAYLIPQQPFIELNKKDTVWSQAMAMKVYTYEIDTADAQLFDIKPLQNPPFPWRYAFGVVLKILLILLLLAAIAYVVWRLVKKKPIIPIKDVPEPDPYDVALSGLEKIKSEKLWQKDQEKEFQTQLTDVLRTYLLKRFNIEALEMTSDEILAEVMKNEECKPLHDELRFILKSADMVKFAKVKLAPDENERSIQNAFEFVENTKKEEEQTNQLDN